MSNGESEPRTQPVNTPTEVLPEEPPEPRPEPASFEEEEAIQAAMETAEAVQHVVAGANLPPGFPKPSDLNKR